MLSNPRRRAQAVYAALLILAVLWLGSILAAPYSMARGSPAVSLFLYRSLSAVCHQMPARSFHWLGYPFGVCSRCAGIYAGFLLGLLAYPWLRGLGVRGLDREDFPDRRWLIASAIPMLVDFGGGLIGLFSNTSVSRAATGAICGVAAACYILPGFVSLCRPRAVEQYL
jgi:uncharacterized membrane protein